MAIEFGKPKRRTLSIAPRRKRVRAVLGDFVFDPWRRNPSRLEKRALEARGLTREHFQSRMETTRVGGSSVRIIGLDDLYVDRLKQATTNESQEDVHFQSALAVAASRYEDLNWAYVSSRIAATTRSEPLVGQAMRRVNTRIRSRARRALAANIEA